MLKNNVFIFLYFICTSFCLNGQEYHWNEPFFINLNEENSLSRTMQVDQAGNTYLTAVFKEEISISDTTLYTSLDYGVYIAKFDLNHNLIWSEVIAEAKNVTPNSSYVLSHVYLKIDDQTNTIYPSIIYSDSTYINTQLYTVEQTEVNYSDIAILKMSPFGEVEDIFHVKGSCKTYFGGLDIVEDDLYFHLGMDRSQQDTDSTCSCSIQNDTMYFDDSHGIYGKIEVNSGQVDWVKTYSASGSTISTSKMVVGNNKIYLTGGVLWPSDLEFQDGPILNIPNTYASYGYLAQLDLQGKLQWSKYWAVNGWDSFALPKDLGLNTENDIVVVANLYTQSVPNQVFFQNASPLAGFGTISNDRSFFVVNYDSLGQIKWHDISNSIGYEHLNSVDFDDQNNLYLAGSFIDDLTFNPSLPTLSSSNGATLVVSYDRFGNRRWAKQADGKGGHIIQADTFNHLHVMGSVNSGNTATFGAYSPMVPGTGNSIFLVQLRIEPLNLEETTPQQFEILIYPNPSIGQVNIKTKNEWIDQITIYNPSGQLIQTLNPKAQTNQVHLNQLTSGYYILDIKTKSGKQTTQKLIVR